MPYKDACAPEGETRRAVMHFIRWNVYVTLSLKCFRVTDRTLSFLPFCHEHKDSLILIEAKRNQILL